MKNLLIVISLVVDAHVMSVGQDMASTFSPDENSKSDMALPSSLNSIRELLGERVHITAFIETSSSWWVGTLNGLYRVKKKNQKILRYRLQDYSLSSNRVTSICVNRDGHIYIGTDAGIVHYDGYAFFPISTENSKLPSNSITALDCTCKTGVKVQTNWDEHWYFINY